VGKPNREAVDLSAYPDLVIIYLGMRASSWRGIPTLMMCGPQIAKSVRAQPDGLLRHEWAFYPAWSPYLGMRQYWRDFDALERFARGEPHSAWWKKLHSEAGGISFWHETYFANGGTEAVYLNMHKPAGLQAIGAVQPARRSMFSARRRLRLDTPDTTPAPVTEAQFYGEAGESEGGQELAS
jgi:hypothetical protein